MIDDYLGSVSERSCDLFPLIDGLLGFSFFLAECPEVKCLSRCVTCGIGITTPILTVLYTEVSCTATWVSSEIIICYRPI